MSFNNGSINNIIVLQHGWGFDRSCWDTFLPAEQGLDVILPDRGYFSTPIEEEIAHKDIAAIICHSFGLYLIPEALFSRCQLLVLLGCFQSFHGESPGEGKKTTGFIESMLHDLHTTPGLLFEKFYKNCGCSIPVPAEKNMNIDLLSDDLRVLNDNLFDLDKIRHIPQILLLHGDKDRIVPLQRSRKIAANIKNASLIEVQHAGHALPFSHPEICWRYIREKMDI
jgi:pimeloyl-ACP methyl ester carboxylesterase